MKLRILRWSVNSFTRPQQNSYLTRMHVPRLEVDSERHTSATQQNPYLTRMHVRVPRLEVDSERNTSAIYNLGDNASP